MLHRFHDRSTVALAALAVLLATAAAAFFEPTDRAPSSAGTSSRPATLIPSDRSARLREKVLALLDQGRICDALRAAQQTLDQSPNDLAVRDEFVRLHLSLAGRMLAEGNHALAETALHAVLKVSPAHENAAALLAEIESARARAIDDVAQAEDWIDLEWFAPAFDAIRRARSLRPDRSADWSDLFIQAAVGTADDHYLCKNFERAFYYYDAARAELESRGLASRPGLDDRRLQSAVQTLGRDLDRVEYPPEYWALLLGKTGTITSSAPSIAVLKSILRGLAHENMGQAKEAMDAYAASGAAAASVAGAREAALIIARRWYDADLAERRLGFWHECSEGRWQVLKTPRFRIHHRCPKAAKRIAEALDFHFDRIAKSISEDRSAPNWSRRCDVYLYENLPALHRATKQSGDVRGSSFIISEGARLRRHEIHVHLQDPLLLSATLPHELAHLLIASAAHYETLPAALSEGLALGMELPARQTQFSRLFRETPTHRTVDALLRCDQTHPNDPAFYAEAHRLATICSARSSPARIIEKARSPLHDSQATQLFGYENPGELSRAYEGAPAR